MASLTQRAADEARLKLLLRNTNARVRHSESTPSLPRASDAASVQSYPASAVSGNSSITPSEAYSITSAAHQARARLLQRVPERTGAIGLQRFVRQFQGIRTPSGVSERRICG